MTRRPIALNLPTAAATELFRLRTEVAVVIITTAQDCAKQYAFDAASRLLRRKEYPSQYLMSVVTEARRYEHAQHSSLGSYGTLAAIADMNDRYDDVTQTRIGELRRQVERSLKAAAVVRAQDMSMLYTAVALVRQAAEIRQDVISQLRNQAPSLCAAVVRIAAYSLDDIANALVAAIGDLSPWTRGHILDLDPLDAYISKVFDPFVDDRAILAAMTGQRITGGK